MILILYHISIFRFDKALFGFSSSSFYPQGVHLALWSCSHNNNNSQRLFSTHSVPGMLPNALYTLCLLIPTSEFIVKSVLKVEKRMEKEPRRA